MRLYNEAYEKYKEINKEHPNNKECLEYLIHISNELGYVDQVPVYHGQLNKAEKVNLIYYLNYKLIVR